jgi:hypothetical protein
MWKQLETVGDNIIDLDAPLATSEGCPIGNKKAKAAVAMAASSERVQTSIDKWKAEVITHLIIRARKADERLVSLMEKLDKKIELEASRVAAKKRKYDFMILTADT